MRFPSRVNNADQGKRQFNGGRIIFSTTGTWPIGYPHVKNESRHISFTKLSKQINVKYSNTMWRLKKKTLYYNTDTREYYCERINTDTCHRCLNPENVILLKTSQIQKDKYHIVILIQDT